MAQSEARKELAKRQALGSTLEQAAARDLKRQTGYEQIDLNRQIRKDQATMQVLSGAISAVSAFAAHMAASEEGLTTAEMEAVEDLDLEQDLMEAQGGVLFSEGTGGPGGFEDAFKAKALASAFGGDDDDDYLTPYMFGKFA